MTEEERKIKTEQCLRLLKDNENDAMNIRRKFTTSVVQMQAGVELRKEKELLQEQLEILVGSVEVAKVLAGSGKKDDEGDGPKELVHA